MPGEGGRRNGRRRCGWRASVGKREARSGTVMKFCRKSVVEHFFLRLGTSVISMVSSMSEMTERPVVGE